MALFHLHCDIIGRTDGRSATAAAAYRATEKIHDETTGEIFDYTRKEKAIFSEIITNGNTPKWARKREQLWNEVEKKENRKNSQFCRSFDIALMKEFDKETNIKLVEKWVKENYVSRGLVADVSIHAPHQNKDGTNNENIHAHILITTRKINSNGWTDKDRDSNDRNFLEQVRTSWAEIVNEKFKELGINEKIDERTLAEQGIEKEPQQHQGPKATAIERKGKKANRRKYKSEELPPLEKIKITKDELFTELSKDDDFKNLLQLLKEAEEEQKKTEKEKDELQKFEQIIKNMNPQEWQNFRDEKYPKIIEQEKRHSIIEAVKPILLELEKLEKNNFTKKKKILDDHKRQKPTIAEKPKLAIFYSFKSDNGRTYNNYDEYKNAQREEISTWQFDHNRILANAEQAQKMYKDVLTAQKTNEPQDLWNVAKNTEKYRPHFFEKIKNKAQEIFETSPLFKPIRAMRDAYENHKIKKNQELLSWANQQKQNRPKTRERNDGGMSR